MKSATNIDEQLRLLKNRGMYIENESKAREILMDIGYYRLGFYWFHMEKSYPNKNNRQHIFNDNASFKRATDLYYADYRIRNIIMPYLSRIEVNLRTFVIYHVSNHYKANPTWFAESSIMKNSFISYLQEKYSNIRKNESINAHHKKYPSDIYAPAWKTLEYMTLGDIIILIKCLIDINLQKDIANHYGIRNLDVFYSYMETIRVVRNLCAHGHSIFDLNLNKSIKSGLLKTEMSGEMYHNLNGVLLVMFYLLERISNNRRMELKSLLKEELKRTETAYLGPIINYIQNVL